MGTYIALAALGLAIVGATAIVAIARNRKDYLAKPKKEPVGQTQASSGLIVTNNDVP